MKKYTTKSTKVYLNSVMETINHSITKNRTDTELSKEYWRVNKAKPQVQFYILKRCQLTKTTDICYLCLKKKLSIIEQPSKQKK